MYVINRIIKNIIAFLVLTSIVHIGLLGFETSVESQSKGSKLEILSQQMLSRWQNAPDHETWKTYSHLFNELALNWKTLKNEQQIQMLCNQFAALSMENLLLLEDSIDILPQWDCLKPTRTKIERHWQEKRQELINGEIGKGLRLKQPLDLKSTIGLAREGIAPPPSTPIVVRASDGPIFFSADLPPKYVALTLDDGPHPQRTYQILDTLAAFNTQVTFFTVGENAKHLPKVLATAANAGHSMGTHSQTHPQLNKLPDNLAQNEIVSGFASSLDSLGYVTPFFRFPYGASNKLLQQFVKDHGWATFFWNIDTLDWKIKDPSVLLERSKKMIMSEQSGIILCHDIHRQTVEVMPWLLRWLVQNGFHTVVFQAPKQTSL